MQIINPRVFFNLNNTRELEKVKGLLLSAMSGVVADNYGVENGKIIPLNIRTPMFTTNPVQPVVHDDRHVFLVFNDGDPIKAIAVKDIKAFYNREHCEYTISYISDYKIRVVTENSVPYLGYDYTLLEVRWPSQLLT